MTKRIYINSFKDIKYNLISKGLYRVRILGLEYTVEAKNIVQAKSKAFREYTKQERIK